MPIEFRCRRCQKLLRTPNETAGKQAQCPQCGEVQTIPPPVPPPSVPPTPPPPAASPFNVPPAANPFNAPPAGNWGSPAGSYNPYQSPQASLSPPYPSTATQGRNGPAWESQGPSPASFVATFKEFFSDVTGFFCAMRVQGGIGLPVFHLFVCSALGGLGYGLQQAVFAAMGMAMPGNLQNPGPQEPALVVGMFFGTFCAMAVFGIVASFLWAGVYHVMLMMLGGANEGFEASYRVVAYTNGHCFLMYLIPCCGSYVGSLASIVLTIIGLCYTHNTSGWKATGAVLLPLLFCCVTAFGLVLALATLTN